MTRAFLITGSILAAFTIFVSCEINNQEDGNETPANETVYTMCSVEISETTGGAFDKLVFKDKDHFIMCKDRENGLPDHRVIQSDSDTLAISYNENGLPEVFSDGVTYVFVGGYSGKTARICAVGPEGETDVEEIELNVDVDEYLAKIYPTKASAQANNLADLTAKSIYERAFNWASTRSFRLGSVSTTLYIAEAISYLASDDENWQQSTKDFFAYGGALFAIGEIIAEAGAGAYFSLGWAYREIWWERVIKPLWDEGYFYDKSDPRSPYAARIRYYYYHIKTLMFGTYYLTYPWYGDTYENEIVTGGANYAVRADDFAWESLPDWITVTPVMKNGKNYLSVYCYPYSEIGAKARNHTIIVYGRAENGSFIDASFEVVQRPHPYATPEYLTLCTAESRKVNILYANGDYKIYDSPLWCKFTSIKNDYFEVRQDPDVKSPQPGTIIVTVPSGKDTFIPIMIEVYPEAEKDVLSCPDGNHPHAIDLGIGIKWACCNVGAYAPTGYGGFYAWGETSTKSYYYWDTYKWYDEGADMLTRYCTMSEEGIVDNITTLLPSDDIAHCSFGGSWRMPTAGECDALITLCSSVWTEIDGVVGRLFTGPNGNRIFLPAGGSFWKGEISGRGQYGRFWSSSLCPGSPRSAYNFGIKNDLAYSSNYSRYDGRTIRPVTQ